MRVIKDKIPPTALLPPWQTHHRPTNTARSLKLRFRPNFSSNQETVTMAPYRKSEAAPVQLQKQRSIVLIALVTILQPPVLRGLLVCQHAHEVAVVIHKDCVCTPQRRGCIAARPECLTRKPGSTQKTTWILHLGTCVDCPSRLRKHP